MFSVGRVVEFKSPTRKADFQEEMSAIKKLFADHGHIVRFSPKCHPELAAMDQDMAFVLQQMEMVEGGCG